MGVMADWRQHWRETGAEIRSCGHAIVKHPCHSLRVFWTHPLLFSFIWFLAAMYFDSVASVVTERTGTPQTPPLRDQGFTFPEIDSYDLPNYLLYATICVTAVRFLPLWPCTKLALARTIFRRWLFLEGVLFWFRAASVVVTSQPKPDWDCYSTATGNVWSEAIYVTFGQHHTCADCMFSGHTAAITLLMLIWSRYSRGEEFAICCGTHRGIISNNVDSAGDPMGFKLLDFILAAWSLMCFYFIIATRFHYSTDVFIGFVITFLLFHVYHFYIKTLAMRQGSFFARFMRWFEGINLAEHDLQVQRDLEAQAGRAMTKPVASDGGALAHQAGAEMTKNNAVLTGNPTATANLPVSYLDGNNYYRTGGDANKELLSDPAAHDPKDGALVGAGARYEHDTTVRVHMHPPVSDDAPQPHPAHNHQLPMPIVTTREHAEQERREVAREVGLGI